MKKYTQMQAKNRREADGVIKFKGVLRYPEANPEYKQKPKGEDTRTAKQRRKVVYREVTKTLEVEAVQPSRGVSKKKAQALTDAAVTAALEAWREEMEAEAAKTPEAKATTVDFVKGYVAHKKSSRDGRELAATTKDTYKYAMRHIDRKELMVPLSDLTAAHIHAWLTALENDGVGKSIANKSYRILSQALNSAVALGHIKSNPAATITADEGKPIAPKPKVNALNEKGLKRLNALLDLMEHSTLADCARLALLCGAREGEICAIRLCDIDGWRNGKYGDLHIRKVISRTSAGEKVKDCPKNGKERAIHINQPMAELISRRVEMLRQEAAVAGELLQETEFLFGHVTGDATTGFYSVGYLSKQWTQFAKSYNIVGDKGIRCSFHALRHSYATLMLHNGATVEEVAQVLGHADPSVTYRVYFEYIEGGTNAVQDRAATVMTGADELAEVLVLKATGTEC